MNILDYIPTGRENGITMRQLCRITGADGREIRRAIAKAREKHAILNMQDGNGYFIPRPDECYLVSYWLKQEGARTKAIIRSLKGAGVFLSVNKK